MRCRSRTFEKIGRSPGWPKHNCSWKPHPKGKHRVAAGGNGRELVGSEAVGLLVMTRARTPMAAALQRPATRIGALGEDRPPIGIGTTNRPARSRLLLQTDGSTSAPSRAAGASCRPVASAAGRPGVEHAAVIIGQDIPVSPALSRHRLPAASPSQRRRTAAGQPA